MTVKHHKGSLPALLSTVSTYYGVSGMAASEEGWDAGPGGDWRGWRGDGGGAQVADMATCCTIMQNSHSSTDVDWRIWIE